MVYIKVVSGVVTQKSYTKKPGYDLEVEDSVCPGMIQNADGTFSSPPKSIEELLVNLRIDRNALLAETDWMANKDVTLTTAWKTYRQALRDITSGLDTVDKVNAVTWPTKPE